MANRYEIQERIGIGIVVLAALSVVGAMCIEPIFRAGIFAVISIFGSAYLIGWGVVSARAAIRRRAHNA